MANKNLIKKAIEKQNRQLCLLDKLIGSLSREYRKLQNSGDDFLLLNIESDIRVAKAKQEVIKTNIDILKLAL